MLRAPSLYSIAEEVVKDTGRIKRTSEILELIEETFTRGGTAKTRHTICATNLSFEFVIVSKFFVYTLLVK